MAGPQVRINTISASIGLDISRKLNMGKDMVLEFIVPDKAQDNDWRILLALTRGFDRITPSEKTKGESREVLIRVADRNGAVGTIIRTKDLHVRLDGSYYLVSSVPQVAPNQAQVYDLTCKVRTLRAPFDTTK